MSDADDHSPLPPPIVVNCRQTELDELLTREWLLSNCIGAYASSTVVGCNTRRYHGLLVAATVPPVGRIVALSNVMEQITIAGHTYHLATNEFTDTFSPMGQVHLIEFRNDVAPTFVFRFGPAELTKEIMLAESSNAVAIRYTLRGIAGRLALWPFVALRDFHYLRKVHEPHQMTFQTVGGGLAVQDRMQAGHMVFLVGREADVQPNPQWWYRFRYRKDLSRGQEGFEDLYTPGSFVYELSDGGQCQFTASLDDPYPLGFGTTLSRRRDRLAGLARAVGPEADETTRRLAVASDAFVAQRRRPNAPPAATILAGFHWFADWGRDAFIALPGLLLTTGRFDQARGVFVTFAEHIADGMIPNRFDDYVPTAHYNSIDAALWFIIAAERYLAATGDVEFWRETLMPAADSILTAYGEGTDFDIRADADGLLTGGSAQTQLTWMDAKLGDEVVTPRHGKVVEVNALWYCAHRIMAERCADTDRRLAGRYGQLAGTIGPAFVAAFWNQRLGCLYDCVTEGRRDASIRPNQIFAVSLPYSALSARQQGPVVRVVEEKLLTPLGLRTLAPGDSRYRPYCNGSWESRDRAYHQGTVWAWLQGPFIEAYLKVHGGEPSAVRQARRWLEGLEEHLCQAGLGTVSEIFDAEGPHTPRGCIAQACSVGEVLRARQLIADCANRT